MMGICFCIVMLMLLILIEVMLNCGFLYFFVSWCIRLSLVDMWCVSGVCVKGDSGWLYSLDEVLVNLENGFSRVWWVL